MQFKNQVELFEWIWRHRAHYSELSGKPLGAELNVWYMAHILPKLTYKLFKLKAFNIVLLTPEEHDIYDKRTDKAKADPRFAWLFLYRQILTQRYNAIPNSKLYDYKT